MIPWKQTKRKLITRFLSPPPPRQCVMRARQCRRRAVFTRVGAAHRTYTHCNITSCSYGFNVTRLETAYRDVVGSAARDRRAGVDGGGDLCGGDDDVRPPPEGINIHQSLARHKVNTAKSRGRRRRTRTHARHFCVTSTRPADIDGMVSRKNTSVVPRGPSPNTLLFGQANAAAAATASVNALTLPHPPPRKSRP